MNGLLDDATLVGPVPSSMVKSTYAINIGRRPDAPSQYDFIGMIDEVRIYERALTAQEITALYAVR